MIIISEIDFAKAISNDLKYFDSEIHCSYPKAVTGPGRSGAIASVYASHILKIPFLPYSQPCPKHLRPLLIIDTAMKGGKTLRKAIRRYIDGKYIVMWIFNEPPRVRFWYERNSR